MPVENLVVVAEFRDYIYPGLISTGKVERGGDKPFHTVITGENYHALEALTFTHLGKVDAIYIDPPYNSGAKDWKYNNDYVEAEDLYRHSKWLAFIERRIILTRKLLNSDNSVLIVTIDEKEYLRLGLLLEQIFQGERIQMVSIAINPAAVARAGAFGRSDEYAFFVAIGQAAPSRVPLNSEWLPGKGRTHTGTARWDLFRRSGSNASRVPFAWLFLSHLCRSGCAKGRRSWCAFSERRVGCTAQTRLHCRSSHSEEWQRGRSGWQEFQNLSPDLNRAVSGSASLMAA